MGFVGVSTTSGATKTIDVVRVADSKTGYATFQSHNQKVVANKNGIFLTYLYAENPDTWRLARSTDGGRTFRTVYESNTEKTRAPAMETDENNCIYLTHPASDSRKTRFLRFTESNGYTAPDIDKTGGAGSASKYAMAYDRRRRQFYHATQGGRLLTFDMSGNLRSDRQLWGRSAKSGTAYPHLFVDSAGVLHHAVTTHDAGDSVPYETIRYIKSLDGGANWQAMDGTAIRIPTSPEPTGPSTMINLGGDEISPYATWLSSMYPKGGKIHFAYRTVNPWKPKNLGNPPGIEGRQHYMRFNERTGAREIDSWKNAGRWQGRNITLVSVEVLIASDPQNPSAPLYAVGRSSDGRLSALISRDNGSTWADYAISEAPFKKIYALGGCREVTRDGKVIGSFGGIPGSGGAFQVFFFSFPACPPAR